MHFLGSPLGRKLVFITVLVNALLATLATGVQLYLSYQRDRSEVIDSISVINVSFREGITDALWEYNYGLIEALLDGMYGKTEIDYLQLTATDGQVWTRGQPPDNTQLVESLSLEYHRDNHPAVELGELSIGLTLSHVQARIWAQFLTLLLANFGKTVMASLFMLTLFGWLVSRHLHQIATHVSKTSWINDRSPLKLGRKAVKEQDELDLIVDAINHAKSDSVSAYNAVQHEVEQRRIAESELAEKAVLLSQSNERLAKVNREQAEFTYAMSHDLKSPTTTVSMLLGEIRLSLHQQPNSESEQLLELAEHTTARMSTLIDNVLDYSRAIEGEFKLTAVNLSEVVSQLIQDLHAEISASGAQLEIDELPTVYGHALQLRMLFQNLLSNAIKFRHEDRTPQVSIRHQKPSHPDYHFITVTDNGIGINAEHHEKVFKLFQRLHTHDTYPGSGLGLTLCQRIVTNHAGMLTLKSELGVGSTFEISLKRSLNDN